MKTIAAATTLAVAALSCAPAHADYPDKPIVVAVQSGPGGSAEIGVRLAAPSLEKCLGVPIVVLNKPGANGDVAYSYLNTAAPDGYTLAIVNVPGVVANSLAKERDYDLHKFTYLGSLTGGNIMISVLRDKPWQTLEELFAHIKESGKPIPISSGGIGSSEHLALLQIEKLIPGVRFQLIPFNDTAASMAALLGGHVELTATSQAESYQDQVRTLAIAAPERIEVLPDVPTFKELGIDIVGGSNHTYAGPPGLPDDVAAKLAGCLEETGKDPEYLKTTKDRNFPPIIRNAAETKAFVESQYQLLKSIWDEDPWIK